MLAAGDGSTGAGRGPVGVVLAGGASRRMGADKARLAIGGESLAARAAARLAAVVEEVAVADRGRGLVPGLRSLEDGAGAGPAAGILGAAAAFPGRPLLILACDLPGVPAELLRELARTAGADAAVPRHAGGIEPLAALYGPAALRALAERSAAGRWSLWDLAAAPGLAVRYLEGEELARFGPVERLFANLNTPEELARWRPESGL